MLALAHYCLDQQACRMGVVFTPERAIDWQKEQEQLCEDLRMQAEIDAATEREIAMADKECRMDPNAKPIDADPPIIPPPGYTPEQQAAFIAEVQELRRRLAAGEMVSAGQPAKPEPKKDVAAAVGLIAILGKFFEKLNVKAWPLWAKCLAFLVVVPILALIYKQQRIDSKGIALFPDVHPGIVWFDDGSLLGKVQYPSGDSYPRDGLAVFHVTWEEYQKLPAILPPNPNVTTGAWAQTLHFPVVVWCNSTGFDSTATPVAVRHANNGQLHYQKKPVAGLVKLLTPQGDGYLAYTVDGTKIQLSEKDFVEQYMGLPYQAPAPPQPLKAEPPAPTVPKVFAPEKK